MPALRSQRTTSDGFILETSKWTVQVIVALVVGTTWSVTVLKDGVQIARNTNLQANQIETFVQTQVNGQLSVATGTGTVWSMRFAFKVVSTNPLDVRIMSANADVTPWPPADGWWL